MANFGSSLAKFAGAGLLQYGQFKYQEQLDAMREANLAKREQARMDQADRHHKEGMTFQREQLKQQAEEANKRMDLTERQIKANADEANRRLDLTERGLANDMDQFKAGLEYKRVEAMDGAFESAYKQYEDTLATIDKVEMEARANPDGAGAGFAEYAATARQNAIIERDRAIHGLYDANPDLAKKSRYYGGEPLESYNAMKAAKQAALESSLWGAARTAPVGATGGASFTAPGGASAPAGAAAVGGDTTDVATKGGLLHRPPTYLPTAQASQVDHSQYGTAGPVVRATLPHFGGTKAELQTLIDKSSGAQRQTLMQIMQQRF